MTLVAAPSKDGLSRPNYRCNGQKCNGQKQRSKQTRWVVSQVVCGGVSAVAVFVVLLRGIREADWLCVVGSSCK